MDPTIDSCTSKNHAPETISMDSSEQMIPPNKLLDKTNKIDIDKTKLTTNSSTSLTAQNSALLPGQVARVNLQQKPANSLANSSSSATGNPRNKTALAPGHSLMDWIRLGSSGVDLTGFKGVPQSITLKELAKHNQRNDAWIAIRGVVYNITRYMDFHPGGVPELMKGVGTDATKMFDDVHAWVNYQSILQKCVIGQLCRSKINEIIPNLNCKNSILSKILPTARGSTVEKIPKPLSSVLEIKTDWKQTTNSISFWYKPTPEQYSLTFRLICHSMTEFVINIHLPNGSIRHEYEMINKIQWPPQYRKSFDTMQLEFCFKKEDKKLWNSYGSRIVGTEKKEIGRIYRDWKVVSNKTLCESVNFLVLKADQYMEIIPVGRHVEVKINVSGTEVSRSYTPVPASFESNDESQQPSSDCICLIVKSYPDGALSPSLTSLQPGNYVTLSNCLGTFVIESFDEYKIVNMLAAGTGLTPMLGIIHRALARRNVSSINLLNFNREKKDVFYEEQLNNICLDTRVKVIHVLSQPKEPWEGKRGLVTENLIKEIIGVGSKQACVFTCGPVGFLSVTKGFLKNLGWNSSQMHEFNG